MRLYLVRHGQTEENLSGIAQGQAVGGTLTKAGRHQAKKIAQRLKGERFDVAYVSDLRRAVDTATEILQHHPHATVIYEPQVRERKMGIHYEGRHRRHWLRAQKRTKTPFHTFRTRGGESYEDLQKRVVNFLNQLRKRHVGQNVLIVSHGAALSVLLMHLFGEPLTREHYLKYLPPNTALSIFEIKETGKHELKLLNSVEHLQA